jgi:hypothetical protein
MKIHNINILFMLFMSLFVTSLFISAWLNERQSHNRTKRNLDFYNDVIKTKNY